MTKSLQIQFLTTQSCSMCEQALEMLFTLPEMAGITLLTVDIANSDDLFDAFAQQIPVLKHGEWVLCWPFDRESVSSWLENTIADRSLGFLGESK